MDASQFQSEKIDELAAALAKAQAVMQPAPKNDAVTVKTKTGGPGYSYKFSDLASVWDTCREALTSNGLAVVQMPEPNELGILLRTTLMHSSGQWITSTLPLLFEGGSMQSMGSAITFARRYMLSAMVGIVSESDDDGAAAHTQGYQRRDDRAVHEPDHRDPEPARNGNGRPASGQSQSGERPVHSGAPRGGRGLFAWLKEQDQQYDVGILKYLNGWGKLQDYPGRIVDWTDEQVAKGHAEAVRKIGTLANRGDAYEEALAN